jgi:hypothetical protein
MGWEATTQATMRSPAFFFHLALLTTTGKKKVKATPEQATKALRGSRGIALIFL